MHRSDVSSVRFISRRRLLVFRSAEHCLKPTRSKLYRRNMSLERTPSLLERTIDRAGNFLVSLVDPSPGPTRLEAAPKTKKEVDWTMVGIELMWSLVLTTASGVAIMYLSRKFTSQLSGEDAPPNSSLVCARLNKIMQK